MRKKLKDIRGKLKMIECLDLDFWDLALSSSRWVWLDHHRVNIPPPTYKHLVNENL